MCSRLNDKDRNIETPPLECHSKVTESKYILTVLLDLLSVGLL